jgi:GH15 family glucan-1,4-alpha-glucosidase
MGHWTEAMEYLEFLQRISRESAKRKERVQVLYGLHGELDLKEVQLPHWEGYRGSAPVNIGNLAESQFQLGIRGELLNTAYELARRGRIPDSDMREFLRGVADYVVSAWKTPDHGIWEIRGAPRHYTYSKVMAWVALDRAIKLARHYGFPGNVAEWTRAREAVRNQVLKQGFNKDIGSFVISFGSRDLDAAALRIPLLQFLPFDDARVQGTMNRVMEQLMENGMVRRYRFEDGLPGKEGAFNLCTFWLADALALSGRVDEAAGIFENVAGRANHAGLFSEEIDPVSGEFLGNFPQAFSHAGVINSALYLAHAQGKKLPEYAQIGTAAHRRELEMAEK